MTPEELEEIARRAVEHSYAYHVLQRQEFANPQFGEPLLVTTEEDLKQHVLMVLNSPESECLPEFNGNDGRHQSDIVYHHPTNTIVFIPLDKTEEPTVFRPAPIPGHPEPDRAYFELRFERSKEHEKALSIISGLQQYHDHREELARERERQRFNTEKERMLKAAEEADREFAERKFKPEL